MTIKRCFDFVHSQKADITTTVYDFFEVRILTDGPPNVSPHTFDDAFTIPF